jgi:peroxiredoxin Q/BCP
MMKSLSLLFVAAALLVLPACTKKSRLETGNKAPDFMLQDETGTWRTLSEFRGKNVVLFFYPHDNTPGCTTQACSFRDRESLYEEHGIVVLGINFDTPESHAAFKEKYHLPFTLLSDTKGAAANAYGAKSGIPFVNNFFPSRVTFLIDTEGNIIKMMQDIDVSTYADEVLKEFGIDADLK